ncbi:hypothetical protein VD0002_g4596 [Verticillium dahliae]|uniref:Uncharacterized protein n=2 Tax=Verticillium dahliae TaxID=27337 RepID=G2XCY0_VERDV|nr:uncharacterized protein VDAG_08012 [Verticillium dahliae VdLs.17]KAF3345606.1 Ubiquitin-60S ribosomal protein L40 [Verticillium dahliae VDG2]KAH6706780.1 hypothetical protein EV126DRAFT_148683 [Verticillium dahliae]EGY16848.1 hypothetical protein VDAG_08012 [Verticillium dahliae VdLs.17]PNH27819.1 hypothetical protein BJF96_g8832 [Verticillium dahliae]PNH55980.1 hypothetical protein VD0003_g1721 [Verticillium dahliae]
MRPSAALGLGLPLAVRGSSPDSTGWQSPGPQSAWIVYNNPATPGHQNSILNLVLTPQSQSCTDVPPTVAFPNQPDATWTYTCHEDDEDYETLHVNVGELDVVIRYALSPSGALEILGVDSPSQLETPTALPEEVCSGFKCAVGDVVTSVKKVFTNVFRPCKDETKIAKDSGVDDVDSNESTDVPSDAEDGGATIQSIAQPGQKAEHPLVDTDEQFITIMSGTANVPSIPAPSVPSSTSHTPTIALAVSGILLTFFLIGVVRKASFPRSEREAARDARRQARRGARAARWASRRATKEERRAEFRLAFFSFINRVFRTSETEVDEEKVDQQTASSNRRHQAIAFIRKFFVRAPESKERAAESHRMVATDLEAQTFVVGSDTDSVRCPSRASSRAQSFSFSRDRDAESITLVGTEGSESGYAGSDSGDSDTGSERSEGSSEGSTTMEMDLAALRDMALRVGRVIGRARAISVTASLPGYTTEDGSVPPAYDEETGSVADGASRTSADGKR